MSGQWVVVCTVFAGQPLLPFSAVAAAFHTDCPLGSDAVTVRRAEDLQAVAAFGRRSQNLSAIGLGSDLDALGRWMGLTPEQRRAELPLDDPDRLLPTTVFGDGPRPPIMPVRHHLAHAARKPRSSSWTTGAKTPRPHSRTFRPTGSRHSSRIRWSTRSGCIEPPRVWYRPYFVCDAAGVAASVAA